MKSALVAIAKDEDDYINEWIEYHFKIGFDNIILYQNNWRANIQNEYKDRVILIEFDTNHKFAQNQAYNHAIGSFYDKYNFIAFFDIDEFLVIKNHSVNEWLLKYRDYDAVGVNWKYFGDSNLKNVTDTYSVKRFTKSQIGLDGHIKTILNTRKVKNHINMHICCHCTTQSFMYNSTISVDGNNFIRGYENMINHSSCEQIAYLAHFRCKTIEEWNNKCDRNSNGIQKLMDEYKLQNRLNNFNLFNCNEIENTDVKEILDK